MRYDWLALAIIALVWWLLCILLIPSYDPMTGLL